MSILSAESHLDPMQICLRSVQDSRMGIFLWMCFAKEPWLKCQHLLSLQLSIMWEFKTEQPFGVPYFNTRLKYTLCIYLFQDLIVTKEDFPT